MSADLNFASIHNDDISLANNDIRSTRFIHVNEAAAAQREHGWLLERIDREAAYQRKEAERAD
jgi:hypothetical protein